MPPHAGSSVNVVEVEQGLSLIKDAELLRTPLLSVKDALIKNDVFPGCFHGCCACQESIDGCDSLRKGIQKLINEGSLQCEITVKDKKMVEKEVSVISIPYSPAEIPVPAKPVPLIVTVPSPVPFSSENAIPWHYGSDVYYHGVKQSEGSSKDRKGGDDSLNVEKFYRCGKIDKKRKSIRFTRCAEES